MNITTEQRDKLSAIQDGVAKKTWDLADRMRERSLRLRDLMATRPRERTAIASEYKKLQELQRQNFRIYIDARQEMANVLAAEQQQRLQRHSY
jgi:Spy/CpxP family protein refolding chaperone